MQALVRGFNARTRLNRAMVAAEYKDDELDRIVGGVGNASGGGGSAGGDPGDDGLGDSFDLDAFLETGIDVPELDAAFFTHTGHQRPAPAGPPASAGTKVTAADLLTDDLSRARDATLSRGSTDDRRVTPTGQAEVSTEAAVEEQDKEERDRQALASELAELATASANGTPMVYGDHRRNRKANRLLQETSAKLQLPPNKDKDKDKESAYSSRLQPSSRDIVDKPSIKRGARDVSSAGSQEEEDIGDGQDMFIGSSPLQPSSGVDSGKNMPKVTDYHAGMGPLEGSPVHNRGGSSQGQGGAGVGSTSSSQYDDEEENEVASLDRPMSAMTDNSTGATPRSRGVDPFGRLASHDSSAPGSAFVLSSGAPSPDQARERGRNSVKKQQQADQLAQEWGISDPKVLALMVKRSKQLKTGGTSGRSIKGATPSASGLAARSMKSSGAFGGKPKTTRGNNKTAGRKGKAPAWSRPDGEDA